MWNNVLSHIVKYLTPPAALFDVKWNLPTFAPANISHAEGVFHISQKYFTCPKGKFRWKKHLQSQVLFSGSPCWARTQLNFEPPLATLVTNFANKILPCSRFAWAGCCYTSSPTRKATKKQTAIAVNVIKLRKEPSSEMDLALFLQKSWRIFEKGVDKKAKMCGRFY